MKTTVKFVTIILFQFYFLQLSAQNTHKLSKEEPQINISVSEIDFQTTEQGNNNAIFSYTISAENLTDDLTVSVQPSTKFKVSQYSYNFLYSYTLEQTNGSIPETEVWVEFEVSETGDFSTEITHQAGDLLINIPTSATCVAEGTPYMNVYPKEINFGNVAVGDSSITTFSFEVVNSYEWIFINWDAQYGFTNSEGGDWLTTTATSGTYDVMFQPKVEGFVQGNITFEHGSLINYIQLTGNGIVPKINISEQELHFGDIEIGEISQELTYTITANSLIDDVTISAPYGFEISLTSNENFTNELTVLQSDSIIEETTIYVRFNPPQIPGQYNGQIIANSQYAEQKNVNVYANLVPTGSPVISISKYNMQFEQVGIGNVSEEQDYIVSAENLIENLIINAPECFEISETSGNNFTTQIVLIHSAGQIYETEIFVRFAPTQGYNYEGIVSNSSTDANQHNINVIGNGLVGINKIDENNFTIYPNPSNGVFTIQNFTTSKIQNLIITDITGKIILNSQFSIFNSQFSINEKGIYFINIKTETSVYTKKLIIQ